MSKTTAPALVEGVDVARAEVLPLEQLGREHVESVGGKSASLGEMIRCLSSAGVRVPGGFSTTRYAYERFLDDNGLRERINTLLADTNIEDPIDLAASGEKIRKWLSDASFSTTFTQAVRDSLLRLPKSCKSVAVRSSATAEDLPDASFAGQQETLLNVPVELPKVLAAIKRVIASLFGDRAIAYRVEHGYAHDQVALCACIQQMVRSDLAVAGVMFTCDSESGHAGVYGITACWGLGETAVGGGNCDEYLVGKPLMDGGVTPVLMRKLGHQGQKIVFAERAKPCEYVEHVSTTLEERSRFCLSGVELTELARMGGIIERHYRCPMDIEWAKDGPGGDLYVVQARPITTLTKSVSVIESFRLMPGAHKVIASGTAVGNRVAAGRVVLLKDASPAELAKVRAGDVIVAHMTDPNYVPAMRLAAAIVTVEGSTKCHAAIIARELGKPAVVAVAGALHKLVEGMVVTVSCAEGAQGVVYEGKVPFEHHTEEISGLRPLSLELKLNVGDPSQALSAAMLPNMGVGLARQEFIVNNAIGVHPMACIEYDTLDPSLQDEIDRRALGYASPRTFYVRRLAEGVGLIARAFYPNRVIVRLSDFKSNEYRELVGGALYEPHEENPMLGFRGAARYLDERFAPCFAMECEALQIVRDEFGLTNVDLMVPFVRTLEEGQAVVDLLERNDLVSTQGQGGMRIGMMCELPSNVLLARWFAKIFDFASIGSNDLTQLVLGADRDSGCNFGDERNEAVKAAIVMAVKAWKGAGKPIGICGQAPSDHAGYAEWLSDMGINSMSLNPDSVVSVWRRLQARD